MNEMCFRKVIIAVSFQSENCYHVVYISLRAYHNDMLNDIVVLLM
jgi:hypothetical protein